MTLKKFAILLATIILPALVRAQDGDALAGLDSLERNLDYFSRHFPQERVYLHFDNTSYYKGEHIYYKASVVRGDDFRPTPLSRILYVELVIDRGGAHGSFLLRDSLNSGFYEVRAYTSWMLNFTPGDERGGTMLKTKKYGNGMGDRFPCALRSNAGIFSRVFPVYERADSGLYGRQNIIVMPKMTSDLDVDAKDRLAVDFYPEGGNLVRGVPSRVAFEAHDAGGRLVDVKGELMRGGTAIGEFASFYGGRGLLNVIPGEGMDAEGMAFRVHYHGRDCTFGLPAAQARGYALAVQARAGTLTATVERNADTEGMALGLLLRCRGRGMAARVIDMRREKRAALAFSTAGLPEGVNIFTLCDARGGVLAQREVFVAHGGRRRLQLKAACAGGRLWGPAGGRPAASEVDFAPYRKVRVDFCLADSAGAPADSASFSVAVTDANFRDRTYGGGADVLTDLLLSSEIKGFVPNAGYYFEKDDAAHRQALDLLLMVQGWTRYDFGRMGCGRRFEPVFSIERGLTLRGRVMRPFGERRYWKSPRREVWVNAEIAAPDTVIDGERLTADGGRFCLNIPMFYGRGQAWLMLNDRSRDVLGERRAGILGHTFPETKRFNPGLAAELAISPENVFPPLAKPYTYYETNFPDEEGAAGTSYDPATQSYEMETVVKTARRRWAKLDLSKPSMVVDIRDMMTYLSEIRGSICSFDWSGFDLEFEISDFLNQFGLAGGIRTYINNFAESSLDNFETGNTLNRGGNHYYHGFGDPFNLPRGIEFLPPPDNMQRMAVFADFHNRDLIYSQAKQNEIIDFEIGYKYTQGASAEDRNQQRVVGNAAVTIRINLLSDRDYIPGGVPTVFNGYRMMVYGISQPDEFYAPDYSHEPLPEETDYRRTVYWNPDVTTDGEGRAHVEFFNNGFSKNLCISAEGISRDGTPFVWK
jgi:hypothetical protein